MDNDKMDLDFIDSFLKNELDDEKIAVFEKRLESDRDFNELYLLANRSKSNPAISSVFKYIVSSDYWSSTTKVDNKDRAGIVDLNDGYYYWSDKSNLGSYVLCVRQPLTLNATGGETNNQQTTTTSSVTEEGFVKSGGTVSKSGNDTTSTLDTDSNSESTHENNTINTNTSTTSSETEDIP